MHITTYAQFLWSSKQHRYLLVREKSINWTGPLCLTKGPTSTQLGLQQQQAQFYSTLTNDYNQQFSNQQAILGTLNNALQPIIAKGPNQFGFSNGEVNTLNSQAIQGTGQQYANASRTLREQQAAAGGGTVLLPSGQQSAQQAALASAAANQMSSQELGIQQAGWQQGYNEYSAAMQGEGSVAEMYNPSNYGQIANTGGYSAATTAAQIEQEQNQVSMENWGAGLGALGSIFGGAGGMVAQGTGRGLTSESSFAGSAMGGASAGSAMGEG